MFTRRSFIARSLAFVAGVRLAIEGAVIDLGAPQAIAEVKPAVETTGLRIDPDTLEFEFLSENRWIRTGHALIPWAVPGYELMKTAARPKIERPPESIRKQFKLEPIVVQHNGKKLLTMNVDTRHLPKEACRVITTLVLSEELNHTIEEEPGRTLYAIQDMGEDCIRMVIVPGKLINFITA